MHIRILLLVSLGIAIGCQGTPAKTGSSPASSLPSWSDSPRRTAILDFVDRVTDPDSPDFVPVEERVAVFDNDGTLWSEQPLYFQLDFALDRALEMVRADPTLASRDPFKAIAEGHPETLAQNERDLLQLVMETHGDIDSAEFDEVTDLWVAGARHPTTGRPYPEMVYQPMLELLRFLEEHEFTCWIVSGGGEAFMRRFAEATYGIPPERVIGSQIKLELQSTQDGPRLRRLRELEHLNDGPGKVIGIQRAIGRRPVIAVGNSDGDIEMMQWTTAGSNPSLCLYVHHTDADREWAYDRDSPIGQLNRGLDLAETHEWHLVDMSDDWSIVHPE